MKRLRVRLRDVTPAVERVVDVPNDSRLDELHEVLQVAVGWTGSHLHQFIANDRRYGYADSDLDLDELDETSARLADLPTRFTYLYDFGDGWEHDVEQLGDGADRVGCVDGHGACPPEDCGGAPGYADVLEALGNPRHREHEAVTRWVGTWRPTFDLQRADELVRNVVGAVPAAVQMVLDLAADGVKLTPGGRLPRAFVRAVQAQRPDWAPLGRPASIEEDLPPLVALHDLLRHVGLLRLRNGVLAPTKAAGYERDTVRRLRGWFPRGEFATMLATDAIALLQVHGPRPLNDLASEAFAMLGPGWGANGRSLQINDIRHALNRLSSLLIALDQITVAGRTWSAGTAATSLLPRAAHLAATLAGEQPPPTHPTPTAAR